MDRNQIICENYADDELKYVHKDEAQTMEFIAKRLCSVTN